MLVEIDNIAFGNTVAHEFGHILGGEHDAANLTGAPSWPWARAYSFNVPGTAVRTLMWSGGSSLPRINRFSTPTQNYVIGNPSSPVIGTANADNLRAVAMFDDDVGDWERGNYCPNHSTGHSTFVNRLYPRLVGVAPSGSAQSAYTNRLAQGWFTAGITNFTYDTAEAIEDMGVNNGNSYRAYELTRAYRTLFGRVPDYGGYTFWLGQRWAGSPLSTILYHFFASSEYTTLHGSTTTQQFVTYLYVNGLGRNPDPGGLAFWTSQIDTHNANGLPGRRIVTEQFINSAEAVAHQVGTTQAVQLYIGLWERTPHASGTITWGNRLKTGQYTNDEVARIFVRYSYYWSAC